MVLLVPFDGSALSEAALARAAGFSESRDGEVLVLTVLPGDGAPDSPDSSGTRDSGESGVEFARERGWLEDGDYDPGRVAATLESRVHEIAPGATFRTERPDNVGSRAWTAVDVARTIRQVAHDVDASIVFVGSDNAGRVTTPVTSVGSPVSEDPEYDVHIVRHA